MTRPKGGVPLVEPNPPSQMADLSQSQVRPAPEDQTDDQTAPPEAQAEAPQAAGAGAIPEDLLKIPAIQGLIAGQPGAVSAPIAEFAKRGEAKLVVEHKDALLKAGMGLYRSLDGQTGVIFNQLYVNPEEIKQADQAGQLLEVAPPFDVVNQALSKAGLAHPVLSHSGEAPPAAAGAPIPTPPQASAAPIPASAQRKTQAARLANLAPGGPTTGASPGAGRLLNAILKPVV